MFLTDNKLEARIQELKEYRYQNKISLDFLHCKEDLQGIVNPEVPTSYENWDQIKVGQTWSGRDRYLWLNKEVVIPAEWKGRTILGIFDFGNTGAGNNSGFESMLYINREPYQGVDANHKEVFLTEDMVGANLNLTFRLWSGLEGGGIPTPQEHKIKTADVACLNNQADDLYYLAFVVMDTIKILKEDNPIRYNLRNALNQAFMLIDWSYPGSDEFYDSVCKADDFLNEEIDQMDKSQGISVKCIGHTHIDVAWLWRLKHTREKCSRSFSTVLRLMEQYPEYIFLQTQPQLYEYIKQDFPEIFSKIKEKAASGNWEVDGGMWVEADCNLTSGESITRQILMCNKFMKQEFGKVAQYLWLPDVFGYSWALPQILKKSGIDMFMTTKISWNQYNRMPHDTFKWIGIDGSEVVTHFITTPAPWNDPDSWFYTYNGELTPFTVKGVWDQYQDKAINKDLLISYGYGDGGGGVNRDTLEQRRRIDKVPGTPSLKTSTAKAYFEELKENLTKTNQYIHKWDGELYLEYHRGTYTSQAYNKRMNRKMEFLYRETEWLTCMAAVFNKNLQEAKQDALNEGWKILLTHQFHDIIPGSSIHEVYEDSKINYGKAKEIADLIKDTALSQVIEEETNSYTILNNSTWNRGGLVSLPQVINGIFKDTSGNRLDTQVSDDCTLVRVLQVPAMGLSKITWEEAAESNHQAPFYFSKNILDTPFYNIQFNEDGQITAIFDKENQCNILAKGEKANVLQMFEDKPLGNDAWDIDIFYQEKMEEITNLVSMELVEAGSLMAVVRMEWNYKNSVIKQDLIVYAHQRRIDFKTWVDFHEQKKIMKVAFPVDIRTTYATYDIQYGNVRRANHWNTSWDQAKFETVAHRWVDLSERDYGVSLLNDCKYGHDIKGNVMRMTLIKSATHPDPWQDQGEHTFTYALLPHKGDFVMGETVKEAFYLNQPLRLVAGKSIAGDYSFLSFDNDGVELDAVKLSEDGTCLVVRFHEYTGSKQTVQLTPGFKIKGYMEADLMERPMEELKKTDKIAITLTPYEIKTLLIEV